MTREHDEQLRRELVEQYKGMALFQEDADLKLRLLLYEDVREILDLLKEIADKMGK